MSHAMPLIASLVVLMVVPARCADWPDHLRTNKLLNMGLNYGGPAPQRLDAFVKMRCRLFLGGASWVAGWGPPSLGALKPYADRGTRAIAYSTPHTIYGDNYFKGKHPIEVEPRSADWLAVDPDGAPIRPWGTANQRYLACINNPGWRAHCREVIKQLVKVGAAGVFWDDAFPFGCHCRHCRAAFREYLVDRYDPAELVKMGVTQDKLPPAPALRMYDMRECKTQLDREWASFAELSLEGFMADLKQVAAALDPGFLFSVNSSQPGVTACMLLSQAVMDLWVYEEGPHSLAPQNNNSLRYLQGFARAARKPVQMIPCGDGWGQEKAIPVQYAASLAEAVACGGEMMVHLGHAEKDDEVWRTDPENAATITRYRSFFDERQALLEGLRPAARVAIFDSNKSAMFDKDYYARLRQLAVSLWYSGVPYTVINAESGADLLEQFDLVLVSFAQVLSEEELQALEAYRQRGGQLVCIGTVGALDERWQPRTTPLGPATFEQTPDAAALQPLLAQAAQDGLRLMAPAGSRVQLHAWQKSEDTAEVYVLHLVNYALDESGEHSATAGGLELRLPASFADASLLWQTPEGQAQELDLEKQEGLCRAKLPDLGTYAMVTVSRLGD